MSDTAPHAGDHTIGQPEATQASAQEEEGPTDDNTGLVLIRGQQADESWEASENRVVERFRAAGLLRGE